MNRPRPANLRKMSLIYGLLLLIDGPRSLMAEPTPAAVSAFNSYSKAVEFRLAQQHRSPNTFLASTAFDSEDVKIRVRKGELVVEKLTPSDANFSGALLHHWRGTAFAPGAKAADFERLMRDFNSYPRISLRKCFRPRCSPKTETACRHGCVCARSTSSLW